MGGLDLLSRGGLEFQLVGRLYFGHLRGLQGIHLLVVRGLDQVHLLLKDFIII